MTAGNGKRRNGESSNGKRKPGGQKIDLTEDQIALIERHAGKLTQEQIADLFGFAERTLRNRLRDDPRAVAAYQRGRAKAIEEMSETLFCRGRAGDMTAAIFYLKTQAGWKEISRQELTGADGGPITTEETAGARTELQRRLDRLALTN